MQDGDTPFRFKARVVDVRRRRNQRAPTPDPENGGVNRDNVIDADPQLVLDSVRDFIIEWMDGTFPNDFDRGEVGLRAMRTGPVRVVNAYTYAWPTFSTNRQDVRNNLNEQGFRMYHLNGIPGSDPNYIYESLGTDQVLENDLLVGNANLNTPYMMRLFRNFAFVNYPRNLNIIPGRNTPSNISSMMAMIATEVANNISFIANMNRYLYQMSFIPITQTFKGAYRDGDSFDFYMIKSCAAFSSMISVDWEKFMDFKPIVGLVTQCFKSLSSLWKLVPRYAVIKATDACIERALRPGITKSERWRYQTDFDCDIMRHFKEALTKSNLDWNPESPPIEVVINNPQMPYRFMCTSYDTVISEWAKFPESLLGYTRQVILRPTVDKLQRFPGLDFTTVAVGGLQYDLQILLDSYARNMVTGLAPGTAYNNVFTTIKHSDSWSDQTNSYREVLDKIYKDYVAPKYTVRYKYSFQMTDVRIMDIGFNDFMTVSALPFFRFFSPTSQVDGTTNILGGILEAQTLLARTTFGYQDFPALVAREI